MMEIAITLCMMMVVVITDDGVKVDYMIRNVMLTMIVNE